MPEPGASTPEAQSRFQQQLELSRARDRNTAAAQSALGPQGPTDAPPIQTSGIRPPGGVANAGRLGGSKLQENYGRMGRPSGESEAGGVNSAAARMARGLNQAFNRGGARGGGSRSEGVDEAKEALQSGEIDDERAVLLKKAIDKFVWPAVPDFLTGAGFLALSFLQAYWMASIAGARGTVKMKVWEHVVLGIASFMQFMAVSIVVIGIFFCVCLFLPFCSAYLGFQTILSLFS